MKTTEATTALIAAQYVEATRRGLTRVEIDQIRETARLILPRRCWTATDGRTGDDVLDGVLRRIDAREAAEQAKRDRDCRAKVLRRGQPIVTAVREQIASGNPHLPNYHWQTEAARAISEAYPDIPQRDVQILAAAAVA